MWSAAACFRFLGDIVGLNFECKGREQAPSAERKQACALRMRCNLGLWAKPTLGDFQSHPAKPMHFQCIVV
jgi:hypothetical protein